MFLVYIAYLHVQASAVAWASSHRSALDFCLGRLCRLQQVSKEEMLPLVDCLPSPSPSSSFLAGNYEAKRWQKKTVFQGLKE